MTNSGLTASDVMALTKDDGFLGGGGVGFIILLFIFIWAVFGGNGFNNGNNSLNQAELYAGLYNQTIDANLRDIRTAQSTTQQDIANANYNSLSQFKDLSNQLSTCCCNNRYEALQNTNTIIAQMNNNTQAILDKLCSQEIQSLRDQLNLSEMANANAVQTQNITNSILGNMGRWIPYAGTNACGCNSNYYTNI